jgi:hypothetical protein
MVAVPPDTPPWTSMGYLFTRLGGGEYFGIDQTVTVRFRPGLPPLEPGVVDVLTRLGGTGGFLDEDPPASVRERYSGNGMDAYILSTDNEMA